MKKLKALIISVFTVAYSIFLSVGGVCALHLFGNALAEAMFHDNIKYPRFIPFCLAVVFLALCALSLLFFFNNKETQKLNYTKKTWALQTALTIAVAIAQSPLWVMLIEFFRDKY